MGRHFRGDEEGEQAEVIVAGGEGQSTQILVSEYVVVCVWEQCTSM